jgi:hypothetical protein
VSIPRLFLGGRGWLAVLAAGAAHRTAQKFGLLVLLLRRREPVAATLLSPAPGFRRLLWAFLLALLLAFWGHRAAFGMARLSPVAITIAVAVAAEAPDMVPAIGTVVPVAVVAIAVVPALLARLALGMHLLRHRRLEGIVESLLSIVVAELVADVALRTHALAVAVAHVARLLQLLTVSHDDARVVLGVLEIILRQHWVSGRLRITSES